MHVRPLDQLRMTDVASVGGKNASLGELISQLSSAGVRVPGGFATTAKAFEDFIAHNGLAQPIGDALAKLDVEDTDALAKAGARIRAWVADGDMPEELERQIRSEYERITAGHGRASFAVR